MANPEHLAILKQGVEVWNRWRKTEPDITPDLSGAELLESDLTGIDLHRSELIRTNLLKVVLTGASLRRVYAYKADLRGACIREADLQSADMSEADFRSADLRAAILRGANLQLADFTAANLSRVDLQNANLWRADFTRTNMTRAVVGWTNFADNDLSTIVNLDTIEHRGPSSLSIDTLYWSKGHIPEVFLRGAGVPSEFIAYIGALTRKPIQFYSCFISYSTRDQDFADRLYADLQAKGVRCWFAPHDVKGGMKLHEQIDEAIRVYDRLLLILSEHSMNSEWVKTEIANARQREIREKRQMLFPVALVLFEKIREWRAFDADTGKDSAREIREYFIPDFSNWKDHDSYQKALERLLRDLKADHGATKEA